MIFLELFGRIDAGGFVCFFVFVIVAAAIGGITTMVVNYQANNTSNLSIWGSFVPRKKILNELTENYRGRMFTSANGTTNLSFASYGHGITVTFYSGKGGDSIQVCAHWPDSRFRMNIFPETLSTNIQKRLGQMQDIVLNDPHFDESYVLQSNNEFDFRSLMSGAVREQIDIFFRFSNPHRVNLHSQIFVSGGVLCFRRPLPRKAARTHIALIDRCVNIVRLLSPNHEDDGAIQIGEVKTREIGLSSASLGSRGSVGVEEHSPLEDMATCLVCGEGLLPDEDLVYCRTCRTPHHRECWHYYGKCSIYACGQSRFQTR